MVDEAKLSAVLSELAHTLTSDFPVQRALDHLVERIVEVLPVSAAGVTITAEGEAHRFVAASDPDALRFESLQSEMGGGPGAAALRTGGWVLLADLRRDERFPDFRRAAIAAGHGAVFAFPVGHGARRLGSLDLYRDTAGGLDGDDIDAAQTLADVAAAYFLDARSRAEARTATELLRETALHDPLTCLPNRLLFEERLEHAARRALRAHTNTAILFADIDHFEQVNEVHGHEVGDAVLVAVAGRLSALLRPGDTLARLAGSEFVFMCEDLRSPSDVETLARRIDNAFIAPFWFEGIELSVTASIGMAFSGPGEGITSQLIVEADRAMYQAKRGSDRPQIIDLRGSLPINDRHDLERDLRLAFARGQLEMAYQPVVCSGDGLVVGVEALLRWTHAERGAVSPIAMVRVAEQCGLINEIGLWALERSCADREGWSLHHPRLALDLAVNVSARQLMRPGFCEAVADVLRRTEMDPGALILEITENVLIEEDDRVIAVLFGLRGLGIRLAMDDFGTGYSSLSHLRRLPIDIVKIDQTFVNDIGRVDSGREIVAAVTGLAHILGLEVTAEGVETRDQRDEIVAIGCESAQGYFFAHPMSAGDIDEMLGGQATGTFRLPRAEASSRVG